MSNFNNCSNNSNLLRFVWLDIPLVIFLSCVLQIHCVEEQICALGTHWDGQKCSRDIQKCVLYQNGILCAACDKQYVLNLALGRCQVQPQGLIFSGVQGTEKSQFIQKWGKQIVNMIGRQKKIEIQTSKVLFGRLYKKALNKNLKTNRADLFVLDRNQDTIQYKIVMAFDQSLFWVTFSIVNYKNYATNYQIVKILLYDTIEFRKNSNDLFFVVDSAQNKQEKDIQMAIVQAVAPSVYDNAVAVIVISQALAFQNKVSGRLIVTDITKTSLKEVPIVLRNVFLSNISNQNANVDQTKNNIDKGMLTPTNFSSKASPTTQKKIQQNNFSIPFSPSFSSSSSSTSTLGSQSTSTSTSSAQTSSSSSMLKSTSIFNSGSTSSSTSSSLISTSSSFFSSSTSTSSSSQLLLPLSFSLPSSSLQLDSPSLPRQALFQSSSSQSFSSAQGLRRLSSTPIPTLNPPVALNSSKQLTQEVPLISSPSSKPNIQLLPFSSHRVTYSLFTSNTSQYLKQKLISVSYALFNTLTIPNNKQISSDTIFIKFMNPKDNAVPIVEWLSRDQFGLNNNRQLPKIECSVSENQTMVVVEANIKSVLKPQLQNIFIYNIQINSTYLVDLLVNNKITNTTLVQSFNISLSTIYFQDNLTSLKSSNSSNPLQYLLANIVSRSSYYNPLYRLFRIKIYNFLENMAANKKYLQVMFIIPDQMNILFQYIQFRYEFDQVHPQSSRFRGIMMYEKQFFYEVLPFYTDYEVVKNFLLKKLQEGNSGLEDHDIVQQISQSRFGNYRIRISRQSRLFIYSLSTTNSTLLLLYSPDLPATNSSINSPASLSRLFQNSLQNSQMLLEVKPVKVPTNLGDGLQKSSQLTFKQVRQIIALFFGVNLETVIDPKIQVRETLRGIGNYTVTYEERQRNPSGVRVIIFMFLAEESQFLVTEDEQSNISSKSSVSSSVTLTSYQNITFQTSSNSTIGTKLSNQKISSLLNIPIQSKPQIVLKPALRSVNQELISRSQPPQSLLQPFWIPKLKQIIPLKYTNKRIFYKCPFDGLFETQQVSSAVIKFLDDQFFNNAGHRKEFMEISIQRFCVTYNNLKLVQLNHTYYGVVRVWINLFQYKIMSIEYTSNGYQLSTQNSQLLEQTPRFSKSLQTISSSLSKALLPTLPTLAQELPEQLSVSQIVKWDYRKFVKTQQIRVYYELQDSLIKAEVMIVLGDGEIDYNVSITQLQVIRNVVSTDLDGASSESKFVGVSSLPFTGEVVWQSKINLGGPSSINEFARKNYQDFINRSGFKNILRSAVANYGPGFSLDNVVSISISSDQRLYNILYQIDKTQARILVYSPNPFNLNLPQNFFFIYTENIAELQQKFRNSMYSPQFCLQKNKQTRQCQICKQNYRLHKKAKQCYATLPFCRLQSGFLCLQCQIGYILLDELTQCQ